MPLAANRAIDRSALLATLRETPDDSAIAPPLARADEVARLVP